MGSVSGISGGSNAWHLPPQIYNQLKQDLEAYLANPNDDKKYKALINEIKGLLKNNGVSSNDKFILGNLENSVKSYQELLAFGKGLPKDIAELEEEIKKGKNGGLKEQLEILQWDLKNLPAAEELGRQQLQNTLSNLQG